ncbi:SNF1-related protein kinase regulatory subunit gamma-1-like [Cynara cardunculus var. scolymus]|uniref:SNF1-related protein kinase regulatory subunit gamma-1-like n=1 Tax=Cynara cardunculus var. scolymus TaxID=59895 RepID=UPI000D628D8A|nr:SNF1-related protein kinase regulatory subunit gamma-1-like [Cynara cardunculus var. scolymus]
MDLRKVEEIVKDSKGGIIEKKEAIISTLSNPNSDTDSPHHNDSIAGDADPTTPPVDAASALQLFLDHIPISSIPGIHNSPSTGLVVRTHERVKDGIRMLYEKNVSGALIADSSEPDPTASFNTSFSHPYVGFISFSNMVLWCLQEFRQHQSGTKKDNAKSSKKTKPRGFFSLLDKIPAVSETKIGELAASFLWDPVFPVKLDQTLFHVLLLLSKHRLSVVPVTERSSSKVVGYVTENSVNHILLQSSGLEWFDSIADKPLSDFRFEHNDRVVSIYNDQSISEAVHILWKKKVCAIAVVQRQTEKLIGCVRVSDIHRLLDDDRIFTDREDTSVEQFIHTDTDSDKQHEIDHDLGALISAGTLALHYKFEPRMDRPVTNKETDTLKQAMQNLREMKSSFSYIIDEYERIRGVVTLRDILVQFAPPCMDSRIDGGGFFDMALKESGCTIRDGTMVHLK